MAAAVDYAALKAAILTWVQDTAGEFLATGATSGDPAVWWQEDAHSYMLEPYIELEWKDGGSQGQDTRIWDQIDGDEDTLTPRILGHRQLILGVEIRSRGDVYAPREAAEALRQSFHDDITAFNLRVSGVAPIRVEGYSAGGTFEYQGRKESVASIELRFGYQAVTANTAITVERVRNAGLRNQIKDCAGNLVGENTELLVGLDYPPGSNPSTGADSPFSSAFSSAFGRGSSIGSGSPFDDAFSSAFG